MEEKNINVRIQNVPNLSVPGAIVIAGLLIAGGIYMSKPRTAPVVENDVATSQDISLKAVTAGDHILGNPDAPVVIVEFSDTECPFCKTFHVTMQTIMNTYGKDGKVAWVYRHFPLDSIHPKARKEAEATECADELGGNTIFWKYTDKLFMMTTSNNNLDLSILPVIAKDVGLDVTKFNTCLSSGKYAATVEAHFQDGMSAGAAGTPYSIMVLKSPLVADKVSSVNEYIANNGLGQYIFLASNNSKIVLTGALPLDIIQKILDLVLQ